MCVKTAKPVLHLLFRGLCCVRAVLSDCPFCVLGVCGHRSEE